MASYPNSVKTFTVKADGATVFAAHPNDLQNEVTAMETALLTSGLAHNLNPSADATRSLGSTALRWIIHGSQITTGTLSPAALSTGAFSSGVTIGAPQVSSGALSSGVTIGAAQVSSGALSSGVVIGPGQISSGALSTLVTVDAAQVQNLRTMAACLVSLDTNVSVVKNTEVSPDWLVEDDDKSGMHSTAANSSRITFTASTGLYAVGVSVAFSTAATATGRNQYVRIVANDTTTVACESMPHILEFMAANVTRQTVEGVYRATSTTEFVTVRVYQESDTTVNLLSTDVLGGKSFWAQQLST
jgi:hypothetical protein